MRKYRVKLILDVEAKDEKEATQELSILRNMINDHGSEERKVEIVKLDMLELVR